MLIQEQSIGIHCNAGSPELLDYVTKPEVFAFVDGHMERPLGAGLGVEIDEAAVRERSAAFTSEWRAPLFTRRDGSWADW